ncbi:MAG: primosomal protein N' [Alphaproteobacteria bacterium]|nr:primosomal protein N' [Alphaproteobacteria bacterium]
MSIISVLTPYPVDKAYDYVLPPHMTAGVGSYVTVPLGAREVVGVVFGAGEGKTDPAKLKAVLAVHDLPPLSDQHRQFVDWVASYNMMPRGMALKLTLSVPDITKPEKLALGYRRSARPEDIEGIKPLYQKLWSLASEDKPEKASELARRAGVGVGVLKTLVRQGYLEAASLPAQMPCVHPDPYRSGAVLSPDQKKAADILLSSSAKPILLDGVTGSGKTEVYFEAVAHCLKQGKQVLILLPEIALSNAFLDRFQSRFGCAPALWHSSVSASRRKTTWRGVARGECKVIVGARSALFLPYANLGLIIVDEEHDPAYKQEEGGFYHARDMAVVRGHLSKIPVILVSATPSLETMHNVWANKYTHVTLPDRYAGASLPDIKIIDLTKDKPERQRFISPMLKQALADTLSAGGQSLLFLNRRGYAPLTLCRTCGHRLECPRCSAWLIEHRSSSKLHCHHCGYHAPIPPTCPACGDKDSLVACGPGVERIFDEVTSYFPSARIDILSSDTATTHDDLKEKLSNIRDHRLDIIIGTQIIAKGHHFPKLTCVGVVDADLGLSGGELRATERTYQLLHQVAGRAGRAQEKGTVYLQTYQPGTGIMKALSAHDRDGFLSLEAKARETSHMPPYSRLAGLILSGRTEAIVRSAAQALARSAPHASGLRVLGPAEAPMFRLRGQYRFRLLVQADKNIDLQKMLKHWLSGHKLPGAVRLQVDIDPQSFS